MMACRKQTISVKFLHLHLDSALNSPVDEIDTPVISDKNEVPASSSFKPTAKFLSMMPEEQRASSPKLQDLSLPSYLDFILFWGDFEDSPKLPSGIALDLRSVLFTMNSLGRLDHFLRVIITQSIHKQVNYEIAHGGEGEEKTDKNLQKAVSRWSTMHHIDTSFDAAAHEKFKESFLSLLSEYSTRIWTKEKFEDCMNSIVTANKRHPFSSSSSPDHEEESLKRIIENLESDLSYP